MIWTDTLIADLTRLWAEGYTAGEIGKALGITSAAVLGKARRLSLPPRRPGLPRSTKPAPDPPNLPDAALRAEPPRPSSARPFPPRSDKRSKRQMTLFRLRPDSCRYPLGGPWDKAVLFCGALTSAGSPYCETHRRICYIGKPAKVGWNPRSH